MMIQWDYYDKGCLRVWGWLITFLILLHEIVALRRMNEDDNDKAELHDSSMILWWCWGWWSLVSWERECDDVEWPFPALASDYIGSGKMLANNLRGWCRTFSHSIKTNFNGPTSEQVLVVLPDPCPGDFTLVLIHHVWMLTGSVLMVARMILTMKLKRHLT